MGNSSLNSANLKRNRDSIARILPTYLRLCEDHGRKPTGVELAEASSCGTRQANRFLSIVHGDENRLSFLQRPVLAMTEGHIRDELSLIQATLQVEQSTTRTGHAQSMTRTEKQSQPTLSAASRSAFLHKLALRIIVLPTIVVPILVLHQLLTR